MIKIIVECDKCYQTIRTGQGFAVIGNIHVINTEEPEGMGGGIIGCVHNVHNSDKITFHYCKSCMTEILGKVYE